MSLKCVLLLIACCIAATVASPLANYYTDEQYLDQPLLVRRVRSPEGGSVDLIYNQDRAGKRAEVQYNQNLYKSSDGRATVDAYAQASRDFDRNRNNYGGGIQGTWHF